jgi:nicotinamide N-methyltransferase
VEMSDSGDEDNGFGLFTEPEDYYPPSPKPTTATHTLQSGDLLSLRLVGHNPLWGHHLWNAGRIISTYFEKNRSLVAGKTVLELGAGAGLPSLVSAILGASKVVVTDYPDVDLIQNLQYNIDHCPLLPKEGAVVAHGYLWGAPPEEILEYLPSQTNGVAAGFDVLILADLLFNHSEHAKLVSTVEQTLKKSPDSKALVFFTPYRPWLLQKDLAFFDLIKEKGFTVEKILEEMMEKVMFEEDRGDEELRRTVFGFEVKWAQ